MSIFSIGLGIKQLSIDKALSKFLSESFPYFIDVEIRDFDNAPSHSEKATSSKLTSSISNQNAEEMPSPETMLQYPLYSQQSIYAVDEIHSPTFVEKKVDYLEDGGFIQGQYLSLTTRFPLLEVDEAGSGIVSDIPTKINF